VAALLYLLFFCSGLSGLVYQVVWVRVFGNVFGNTVYSTSLVVAVFMLGLGAGSYVTGAWADRRYAAFAEGFGEPRRSSRERSRAEKPDSLLRAYGYVELIIGVAGLGVSLLLPHLDRISALVSSYSREPSGWYVLSIASYFARAGIAVVLLAPITILMGGTLTLLIRHLVRHDLDRGGGRIAVLYGINTVGAALGAFLTDFSLVPSVGLLGTQIVAVVFNLVAGAGALWLARHVASGVRQQSRPMVPKAVRLKPDTTHDALRAKRKVPDGVRIRRHAARDAPDDARSVRSQTDRGAPDVRGVHLPPSREAAADRRSPGGGGQADRDAALWLTGLALAMSGFAAMGMEILWFRHLTILLGQFRAVFSLLLTVILVGAGAGSLLSGSLYRRAPGSSRSSVRAAKTLMVVQGLFVAFTLLGLAVADAARIESIVSADPAYQAFVGGALDATLVVPTGLARTFAELWFNVRPILLEVGLPALLMGFSFPLGNAIIQRAELLVGRRAGALYLSNTVGAVFGSLAAGFLFLPWLGIQGSASMLMATALLSVVPLYLAGLKAGATSDDVAGLRAGIPPDDLAGRQRTSRLVPSAGAGVRVAALLAGGAALGVWLTLPADWVIARALPHPVGQERRLSVREGLTEVVAVTDVPGRGRRLLTNGHPMSSTTAVAQRYMRALAHIPLLTIDHPEAALVIGFGVGNTTHAATLHPSIRRVEVADLSRDILGSAGYFRDVNRDVLGDPRVDVYINDGRHHLQMRPPASYDLITLEPPPIGYAGVSALYSEEFYALARTRLRAKGYVSQWLPAYQVPGSTTLAMIRAFIDVFPQAVLVSGAEADLLLLGTNDSRIEMDPGRLAAALARAPAVQADLRRLDLGSVREIVGTFVGSAQTLTEATRDSSPVSDDRPIQEYGVRSLLNLGEAVPGSIVDLNGAAAWCPGCFVDGQPAPLVEGLDTYLALLGRAYRASHAEVVRARRLAETQHRVIAGSAYLGAVVPESADVHNVLGIALATKGQIDEAIGEFRQALQLDPESAATNWHLGAALASQGAREEALEHLRRSVRLDPGNSQARHDLEVVLASDGRR